MKDGYYWARKYSEWDIVFINTFIFSNGKADSPQDVLELGSDVFAEIDDFEEFGDEIERPMKYNPVGNAEL